MRRHLAIAATAAAVLFAVPALFTGPAAAADLKIEAFYGKWAGSALTENNFNLAVPVVQRDLDVSIQPGPTPGSFSVAWTTVQNNAGADVSNTQFKKATTFTYVPAGNGRWKAQESVDPMQGAYSWARIANRTLVIYVVSVDQTGALMWQKYNRTLGGNGMNLTFQSRRDGEKSRTVRGTLIKNAN